MDQIKSRQSIREEAAHAAREGMNRNPYPADTDAGREWSQAYIVARRGAGRLGWVGKGRDAVTRANELELPSTSARATQKRRGAA